MAPPTSEPLEEFEDTLTILGPQPSSAPDPGGEVPLPTASTHPVTGAYIAWDPEVDRINQENDPTTRSQMLEEWKRDHPDV